MKFRTYTLEPGEKARMKLDRVSRVQISPNPGPLDDTNREREVWVSHIGENTPFNIKSSFLVRSSLPPLVLERAQGAFFIVQSPAYDKTVGVSVSIEEVV